ncbi:hypothetical protein OG394_24770 [Kribbella sp. NBC_01245]|uniref:hypothetical protein n=1 Tax=Kribbella sp. NBC_01245 TaxID=2903578 RepID=UPI002E2E84D2|nr:hypothetical protein [Kribbella sp. NBC_01245]
MDLTKATLLREMLTGTELGSRTTQFAYSLRRFTTRPRGLMLFGPRGDEPWHLTAHLDDELHRAGVEDLRPALVRWEPPADAPPHLAIGLDRLSDAGRGESLLVVSEEAPPERLLERIEDVRRRGTTIFSIDNGDKDLASLSHESLVPELLVPDGFGGGWLRHQVALEYDPTVPEAPAVEGVPDETIRAVREAVAGFEMTQHFVSLAVADEDASNPRWRRRLRTLIERLGGDPG